MFAVGYLEPLQGNEDAYDLKFKLIKRFFLNVSSIDNWKLIFLLKSTAGITIGIMLLPSTYHALAHQ